MIAPIRVKAFELPTFGLRQRPAREAQAETPADSDVDGSGMEFAKLRHAQAALERVESSSVLREVE